MAAAAGKSRHLTYVMLYHVSVSSDDVTLLIMCCGVKCGAGKVGYAGLAGGDKNTSV